MKKIIDLNDLLKHEQIIEELPVMIENVNDPKLKEALSSHLEVSKTHKERLDKIKEAIMGDDSGEKDNGFLSNLFGGSNTVTSKGIEGLIKEAGKMMSEDLTPQAMDAAIIGIAQKIEHYQIAGYGTVRAYASELKLDFVTTELEKTLREEYDADDSLTKLAVGQVNPGAENAINDEDANDGDYDRLTNSVSIMSTSDSSEDDEG
jgi:ferritin-like metal-binding protein YciE